MTDIPTDRETLTQRVEEIEKQVRDVADYLCSRGDTMPMRAQVEARTRRVLHALASKGWSVVQKEQAATLRALAAERDAALARAEAAEAEVERRREALTPDGARAELTRQSREADEAMERITVALKDGGE